MCGIVGYISRDKWNLESSVSSINHRGPDYRETSLYKESENFVGFGHARLSIIDPDPSSNQPMSTNDREYSIIYNGEIYNYLSLKEDLKNKGYTFQTKSDTEVLLKYYRCYGVDGLSDLQGMFAFSILDKENQEVILVRDQLGIKPIYYWHNEDGIYWASEMKALWTLAERKASFAEGVFEEYLSSGFIYEPETGFKEVFKVPPASYLKISLTGWDNELEPRTYWSVNLNRDTTVEAVKDKVTESIKSHLVSDVPVGLFFSGGVDSTIILSKLDKDIQSFIVKSSEEEYEKAGFESDFQYGKKIASLLDVKLNIISLNSEIDNKSALLKNIRTVASLSEEPIADFTFISSMLLARKARESGYKVMLSGMGADEIFGGYPRYKLAQFGHYFSWLFPMLKPLMKFSNYLEKKIERFQNYYNGNEFSEKYNTLLTPFSREEINSLLRKKVDFTRFDEKINSLLHSCPFNSPLKKAMYLDRYGFLSHNFLVADKSSMQASLELRVPLATHELYEMCMNLDDNKLVKISKSKIILKDILYDVLPKKIVDRRKAGFHPPLDKKINSLGKKAIIQFVTNNKLFEIVNRDVFDIILNKHFEGSKNNTFKIYRLMYLSAWYYENR